MFNMAMAVLAASAVTPTVVSASVRTRPAAGVGTAGANFIRTARIEDYALVPCRDPWIEYSATYVNTALTTAPHEVATTNATPVAGAFLVGLSGNGQNQSGATLTPVTWNNAAAGTAGYVGVVVGEVANQLVIAYKNGSQFSAAGGSISGDGITLTLPGGWWARSDSAVGVQLNGRYAYHWEGSSPQGQQYLNSVSGRTSLADLGKDSTVRSGLLLKDWTSLTGVGVGTVNVSPCAVFGISDAGKRCIGIDGDSIHNDNFDRDGSAQYGDAFGSYGYAGRAARLAGYPFVRTAISGEAATPINTYGGWALRRQLLRFCSAILTDMGHNDRGFNWSTFQPVIRAHWARLRAAGINGDARIIPTTWMPQASSTDNWLTPGAQTATMGPGTMGYDSYNPFLRAGVYNRALGDPDAFYDAYARMYALAAANGATDVTDGKWPTNGTTAKLFANDATHPTQLVHTYLGADLATQLPTLLGWAA